MTDLVTLYKGIDIHQSHKEILQPISINEIASQIKLGDAGLKELCAQLATILRMDKSAYIRHKTRLPYVCCGTFDGNIRNGRPAIIADNQVALAFISPSRKGFKVLFMLDSPITLMEDYRQFFRNYALHFSEKNGLGNYIDQKTCDATRVSFLSYDPECYMNSSVDPVQWQLFLPQLHAEALSGQNGGPGKEVLQGNGEKAQFKEKSNPSKELPAEVYKAVVERLNPKAHRKTPKQVFVPEILEQLAVQVQAAIILKGFQLKDIKDINYGKKIVIASGFLWAEVNIFYGKRGFTVIRSPKANSDQKLGEQLEFLIWEVLNRPAAVDYGMHPDDHQ
ncbi:BT4734/BF3469 family protein [Flavihumibacter profundi]|uniref:BT4734/BF3469 family protein n=1 Tax=Flavihumibacter profundi TaxID=2716883 RepID=UPI001CC75404|nr:BT4734/BF3469 family protein [Flavihumibacter profundi]MBZ5857566.1 hypothetical protein [Flavihumibacter profundi]